MIIQSLEFSQHFTRLVIQFYITPARQPIKNWHICNYLQQRAPFSSCLVYLKKTKVGFLHFGGAKRYIPYISSKIVQSEAQKVHQASRNCFAAASNCSTAWEKQSDWRSHRPLESDCQKPRDQEISRIFLASNCWLSLKLLGKKHGPGPFWFFSSLPNRSNSFQLPGDENLRIWPLPKCPRTHLEALHLPTWPWNVTLKNHPGVPKTKQKNLARRKVVPRVCQQNIFSWTWMSFSCHFHVMNEGKQWLNLDNFLTLEKTPLHFSHQQGLLRSQVCMQRPLWSWRSGTWDLWGAVYGWFGPKYGRICIIYIYIYR